MNTLEKIQDWNDAIELMDMYCNALNKEKDLLTTKDNKEHHHFISSNFKAIKIVKIQNIVN